MKIILNVTEKSELYEEEDDLGMVSSDQKVDNK